MTTRFRARARPAQVWLLTTLHLWTQQMLVTCADDAALRCMCCHADKKPTWPPLTFCEIIERLQRKGEWVSMCRCCDSTVHSSVYRVSVEARLTLRIFVSLENLGPMYANFHRDINFIVILPSKSIIDVLALRRLHQILLCRERRYVIQYGVFVYLHVANHY